MNPFMCAVLLQPLEVDNPLCWIRLAPPVIFIPSAAILCTHAEGEPAITDMRIWHINCRNPVIPEDPLLQQT